MFLLHLLGILLFVFGLIGLIRPSRLHQMVVIRKFSLAKRWGNLILVILGLAMLYSMIFDFIYVLGMVVFLFGLIGLIYPTRLHQTVTIRKFSLGKRLWNLLMIACSVLIMVAFSDQILFGKNPTIPDKQEVSPIEVAVKKLKDLGQEGQKRLAELASLINEPESAVTHQKIELTPKPAKVEDPVTATKPPYRGTNVVCADFSSSAEATAYMKAYGVTKLDRDGDGVACETLESGDSTNASTSKPPYRGMNLTCDDFATGDEVEAYMAAYGYIYDLDPDGDGVVCESTEFYPEEPPWFKPSPKAPDYWENYEENNSNWSGDTDWSNNEQSEQSNSPSYEEKPTQSEKPVQTDPEYNTPNQSGGTFEQQGQSTGYEESE